MPLGEVPPHFFNSLSGKDLIYCTIHESPPPPPLEYGSARHRQEQESTGRRIRSSLQGVSDQIYLLLVPLLSSSPTVLCLFFPFQAYC